MIDWHTLFWPMLILYLACLFVAAVLLSLVRVFFILSRQEKVLWRLLTALLFLYPILFPIRTFLIDTVYWQLFESYKYFPYTTAEEVRGWNYYRSYYAMSREIVKKRAESQLSLNYDDLNRATFHTLRNILPAIRTPDGKKFPRHVTRFVEIAYWTLTLLAGFFVGMYTKRLLLKNFYDLEEIVLTAYESENWDNTEWRFNEMTIPENQEEIENNKDNILRHWNRTKTKTFWLECFIAWVLGEYSPKLREFYMNDNLEPLKRLSLLEGGKYDQLFKQQQFQKR